MYEASYPGVGNWVGACRKYLQNLKSGSEYLDIFCFVQCICSVIAYLLRCDCLRNAVWMDDIIFLA
ncbi:hypothetical protein DLD99_15490 [Pseudomonas kribbensis]|uniref:Uncharacterized protein n=1 Tax=Pseudomonas kribbensis TaxID=1628086 RepID=A0A345RR97_9PSED|nr:hypothetical protein DLD99_15490 [Pseudomonas kribbensis]